MANIQSQKKRNRQNARRQLRNKAIRAELRTRAKTVIELAKSGDAEGAAAALATAQRRIDKAAAKGVLKPNTAARRKSRLAKAVNARLG